MRFIAASAAILCAFQHISATLAAHGSYDQSHARRSLGRNRVHRTPTQFHDNPRRQLGNPITDALNSLKELGFDLGDLGDPNQEVAVGEPPVVGDDPLPPPPSETATDTATATPSLPPPATSEAPEATGSVPPPSEPAPSGTETAPPTSGTGTSTPEPPISDEPTSEPATSFPVPTSEPATSLPIPTSEPAASEPATSEPATSEPATSEPATSEPETSEPATTSTRGGFTITIGDPGPTSSGSEAPEPTSEPPTSVPETTSRAISTQIGDPPSQSQEPTSSPVISEPPPEPTSSSPPTSFPPEEETSSSIFVPSISVPSITTRMEPSETISISVDPITTETSRPATSIALPSEFSYLTEPSLIFSDIPTTTISPSVTDPDQPIDLPTTTPAGASDGSLPTAPSFPSGLPRRILPADSVDPETAGAELDGYTMIGLLFTMQLSWEWVVRKTEAAGQLFAYTPQLLALSLNIPLDQVKTVALQAFIPTTYNGDAGQLRTLFVCFIPDETVADLAAQLKFRSSAFYSESTGVPHQIASFVDPSYPINAAVDLGDGTTGGGENGGGGNNGASSGGGNNTESEDNVRRNAIIGVCSAVGGLVLIALGVYVYRTLQRNREQAHRRLSGYSDEMPPPMMAQAPPGGAGPYGYGAVAEDGRRRSFYYAEDSLRGYAANEPEDDTYVNRASPTNMQRGGGRAPVVPSAISQPILQQSSLHW